MPRTLSPLRYPGGKTQIAPFVQQVLDKNNWLGGVYCEPFAGGCGIAWDLLLNNHVSKVVINDISPAIYSFWHSVLEETDRLCERIERTDITIDEWYRQKDVLKNAELGFDLGYAAFFLNRVNRSGILTAGVIGGKAQNGSYKLDCRFNKFDLIKKIKAISARGEDILLTNLDANDFLRDVVPELKGDVFINIDPPYYNKGKELYQNFFKHEDHVELFNTISNIEQPWMLTYDNTPEIIELYMGFEPSPFSLNYSAQVKRKGSEVVCYSPIVNVSELSIGVG